MVAALRLIAAAPEPFQFDQAGARIRLRSMTKPPNLAELEGVADAVSDLAREGARHGREGSVAQGGSGLWRGVRLNTPAALRAMLAGVPAAGVEDVLLEQGEEGLHGGVVAGGADAILVGEVVSFV